MTKKSLEYQTVAFEVKQIDDNVNDGFFRFEGLASTFGNVDLGYDVVEPGAFKDSLATKMPIILWQHNRDEPIGMPEQAYETPEGLYIKVRLPMDDDLVRGRVIPQIKVGSIRTMSIGYRVNTDGMFVDTQGIRHLSSLELREVSLVTFAMNPLARVTGFKALDGFFVTAVETNGKLNKEKALAAIDEMDFATDEFKSALRTRVDEDPTSLVDHTLAEKYITKADLHFLDNISTIDQRALEKALSDSGLFSKNAACKLVSFLRKSDSNAEEEKTAALAELARFSDTLESVQLQNLLSDMNFKLEH